MSAWSDIEKDSFYVYIDKKWLVYMLYLQQLFLIPRGQAESLPHVEQGI